MLGDGYAESMAISDVDTFSGGMSLPSAMVPGREAFLRASYEHFGRVALQA